MNNYRRKDTKEEFQLIGVLNYGGEIDKVQITADDKKQSINDFNSGFIAINPHDKSAKYLTAKYVANNFEFILPSTTLTPIADIKAAIENADIKTLNVTNNKDLVAKVSDVEIFGEDIWKLICKASSKSQGWMKSTKAMEIAGVGCIVQVTTQQGVEVSEAVAFVPNVRIHEIYDGEVVVARKLVSNQ